MDLYYQNETLYIELIEDLDETRYIHLKQKLVKIIEDYGVDRVVLISKHQIFHNRHFLRQMKQDLNKIYFGELFIR